MRILILGAGGTGGYFGGRLVEAGADVTFLVRSARQELLRRAGLVIRSPMGDANVERRTIAPYETDNRFDIVIVACKAYDLAGTEPMLAPHLDHGALLLPLLNGMAHINMLRQRFGKDRVLGGLCGIFVTLSAEGEVVQLEWPPPRLSFGRFRDQIERNVLEEPARAIEQMMGKANFISKRVEPIEQGLWDKWVVLAAMAAGTCLMRGSIGSIVAASEGATIMEELVAEAASVARAAGYGPSDQHLTASRGILTAAGSDLTASMLRDVQKGGPTEGEHIVGDLLRRARELGVATPLLRVANAHLQTYEAERAKS